MNTLYVIFKYNNNEIEPLFCVYDNATNPNVGICSYLKELNDDFDYVALAIGETDYSDSITRGSYSKKGKDEIKQIELLVKVNTDNVPLKIIKTNQKSEVGSYAKLLNSEKVNPDVTYKVFSVRGKWSAFN